MALNPYYLSIKIPFRGYLLRMADGHKVKSLIGDLVFTLQF